MRGSFEVKLRSLYFSPEAPPGAARYRWHRLLVSGVPSGGKVSHEQTRPRAPQQDRATLIAHLHQRSHAQWGGYGVLASSVARRPCADNGDIDVCCCFASERNVSPHDSPDAEGDQRSAESRDISLYE